MEYMKPFGQFIEFDNSDIIVTSDGDLPCNAEVAMYAFCVRNGNSEEPNLCGMLGLECTRLDVVECRYNHAHRCDAKGSQIFYNSPRPIPED